NPQGQGLARGASKPPRGSAARPQIAAVRNEPKFDANLTLWVAGLSYNPLGVTCMQDRVVLPGCVSRSGLVSVGPANLSRGLRPAGSTVSGLQGWISDSGLHTDRSIEVKTGKRGIMKAACGLFLAVLVPA